MNTESTSVYSFDRDVVFKATDSSGTVLKQWTVSISFVNNTGTKIASGTYVLTDVPADTANLSSKTAWSLRTKEAVIFGTDMQAVVDFTILGGDLNNSNSVNILDFLSFRLTG